MTSPYKKRLKSNWTAGKEYKDDKVERRYSRKEIIEALYAPEVAPYRKPRKRNMRAHLEYRVAYLQQCAARYGRHQGLFTDYWKEELDKAMAALAALPKKDEDKK